MFKPSSLENKMISCWLNFKHGSERSSEKVKGFCFIKVNSWTRRIFEGDYNILAHFINYNTTRLNIYKLRPKPAKPGTAGLCCPTKAHLVLVGPKSVYNKRGNSRQNRPKMRYTTTVATLCGRLSSRRSDTLINVQKNDGNINTFSCIVAQTRRNNHHIHTIYIRVCSWRKYLPFHASSIT